MQRTTWQLVSALALTVTACSRGDESQLKNTFGTDDRVSSPDAAPYRAVGRLDSGCTGTLIGKRLVLTAAHCVYDATKKAIKANVTYFHPNLRTGQTLPRTWIESAWVQGDNPETDRLKDYAVLRLDRDIGTTFGTLAVQDTAIAAGALPYPLELVGYSIDRNGGDNPNVSHNCAVRAVIDGKLFHDCDSASGISGAPLLAPVSGKMAIVGISVSEYRQGAVDSVHRDQYSDDYANVGVPASAFLAAVTQAITVLDPETATSDTVTGLTKVANTNARDSIDPLSGAPSSAARLLPSILTMSQLYSNTLAIHSTSQSLYAAGGQLYAMAQSTRVFGMIDAAQEYAAALDSLNQLFSSSFFSQTTEEDGRLLVATRLARFQNAVTGIHKAFASSTPSWVVSDINQSRNAIERGLARLTPLMMRQP